MTFKFRLGESATLKVVQQTGQIIARTEYTNSSNSYLLRYRTSDGRAVEEWWKEDALSHFKYFVFDKDTSVYELPLTTNSKNALMSCGIETLGELLQTNECHIESQIKTNATFIKEIKLFINEFGEKGNFVVDNSEE